MSSRSKERPKARSLPIAAESSAVHGENLVNFSAAYSGGSGRAAAAALTPSAYASSAARARAERSGSERTAARCSPMVRSCTSLGRAPGPSNSASVPAACRRCVSIWKSRSSAWTQPCKKNRSCSLPARMWGIPAASRDTSAAACRPASRTGSAATARGQHRATSASRRRMASPKDSGFGIASQNKPPRRLVRQVGLTAPVGWASYRDVRGNVPCRIRLPPAPAATVRGPPSRPRTSSATR